MSALAAFIRQQLDHDASDVALFKRAVTHPSFSRDNYQRLEFLGDRVLALVMAEWLSDRFPDEPEGQLSHRFTTLVSRAYCAQVGLSIGLPDHLLLGRQARSGGVSQSDNVIGDAVEALIAALYIEGGLESARRFIVRHWGVFVDQQIEAPRHPKALLIEWAEGRGFKPPSYALIDRSGPDHALRFTVRATVKGVGEATGEGSSKQEAETAAAEALLKQVQ